METRVMLTMESRIHGDMYVRFGGRLVETYHRKVAKRYWPSLLKEIADLCGIKKNLTTHTARHSFASVIALANNVSLPNVAKMLGHSSDFFPFSKGVLITYISVFLLNSSLP